MARRRQSNTNSKRKTRGVQTPSIADLVKKSVSEKIERARRARDARERAQEFPDYLERPAPKTTRAELKRHGFYVTRGGVIVDGPRDKYRRPIKGARVTVMRGGVVKTSVGQRRDYIYGFTAKEKIEFALDPGAFEKKKLRELKSAIPTLKNRRVQVRLQWGAYQAQKDFTPTYFSSRYLLSATPEKIRKHGARKAPPRIDALTGLHLVVHVARTPTAGKQKRKRANKKAGSKGRKRK